MMPSMQWGLGRTIVALALTTAACGGARSHPASRQAAQCEVTHTLQGDDTIDTRVGRIADGWAVSLRLSVRLDPDVPPWRVHGLGRVTEQGGAQHCQIVDAGADPGSPRFDEALCLDEFDSLADILQDAEGAAHPGETVTQDVQLRTTRRHHPRSRVVVHGGFLEHAEVTRDALGRVVRIARVTDRGAHEEIRVTYPANDSGRCLPPASE